MGLRHFSQYTLHKALCALSIGMVSVSLLSSGVLWANKQALSAEQKPTSCHFMAQSTKLSGEPLRVIGAEPDAPIIETLNNVIKSLTKASNQHDIAGVLSHYAPHFKSGDNLSLKDLQKMLKDTWTHYPDIQYQVKPIEIRIHGDWATVETLDSATATSKPVDEPLPNETGQLYSQSRGMVYLHRVGKSWEITGDRTLYENAIISYGKAKGMDVTLSAPDQVFAGDTYTARIQANIPDNLLAITSIASDPIMYPQAKPDDRFRSLSQRTHSLERVFEANPTHHNEMITATLGLTRVEQDAQNRPLVTFEGIATIMKRVNVFSSVPEQFGTDAHNTSNLVQHSADGWIDLRTPTTPEGKNEQQTDADQSPSSAKPAS